MNGQRLKSRWNGESCPDPFRSPPPEALVEAQKNFVLPSDFHGRVGALVFEKEGSLFARYAIKPNRILSSDYRCLTEEMLWPVIALDSIPDAELYDSFGRFFSFREFLTERLNTYPAKDAFHGGKKLSWFKGEMLFAMKEALSSPTVQLLSSFNQERKGERLVALGEWHAGTCEAYDIRFDQTFYPPMSSGKSLLLKLLSGHPIASLPKGTTPKIPVLYEDQDVLIVNKPPHLASVPSVTEPFDALTILSENHGALYDTHRLDMATSGIILYAKNKNVQSAMHRLFRSRKIDKSYVALLDGNLEKKSGIVRLPLGVNRLDRPRQCVLSQEAGGKIAETYFEMLEKRDTPTGEQKTLVRLTPKTGRTHQLRIHCAHKLGLNAAILGDVFYGREGLFAESHSERLFLHAERLRFSHPNTGKIVEVFSESGF